ncbi:acylphosphatase-2 isoform X2 [Oncorhynchus mykiss]|nr:acylphosphatase-2 isoform X2 [Oncorhynchus mykiss]XP_046210009.1 acylphosphatase-2-like isoform X3 [Oncorhynchus gorbuscha]
MAMLRQYHDDTGFSERSLNPYTEKEGLRLGLCGWVKNTNKGTVVGQVQGPADMICEMKVWLCKEGSPSCSITRASFSNERSIDKVELFGFKTRF